ncbi:MAG: discoidin domain-containing protein [Fibrobacterota bacterium]|nr:discoidin domain-containing protein [Fibrobacterota bacterium]
MVKNVLKTVLSSCLGMLAFTPFLTMAFAASPVIILEYQKNMPMPTGDPYAWNGANVYPLRNALANEPKLAVNWLLAEGGVEYKSKLYFYDGNLAPMASFFTTTTPDPAVYPYQPLDFKANANYEEFMNVANGDLDGNGKTDFITLARKLDHGVYTMEWDPVAKKMIYIRRHPGTLPDNGTVYQRGLAIGEFSSTPGKEVVFGGEYGALTLVDNKNSFLAEANLGQTIQNIIPVDLDNDGIQEIIVATGRHSGGKVFAYWLNSATGKLDLKWTATMTPLDGDPSNGTGNNVYEVKYHPNGNPSGGPAIAGTTESEKKNGVTAYEGSVFLLKMDGTVIWQKPFPSNGGRPGGCEFVDINGDGRPEIITRASDEGHKDVVIYDNFGNILSRTNVEISLESSGPYVFDYNKDGTPEVFVFGDEGGLPQVKIYRMGVASAPDLAFKKTIRAGANPLPGYPVSNAVDGNPATQWTASTGSYPQHITVDLGVVSHLSKTRSNLEAGDGTRYYGYTISVSKNDTLYTQIVDRNSNREVGSIHDAFNPVEARFIRLTLNSCNNGGGVAVVKDFEAFGFPDLALGKATMASSFATNFPPGLAVDGLGSTQWVSANPISQGSQYLRVDLGSVASISSTIASVEDGGVPQNRFYGYKIETSIDGTTYSLVSEKSANKRMGKLLDAFNPVNARYVKFTLLNCNVGYGTGVIKDLRIYGMNNLAQNLPVAFSSQQTGYEAIKSVDGTTATRWSAGGYNQFIQVDLGITKSVSRLEIAPYSGKPYQYEVLASNDGTSFFQVVNRLTNTQAGGAFMHELSAVNARYWRLRVTGCNNDPINASSISEFRVFGR